MCKKHPDIVISQLTLPSSWEEPCEPLLPSVHHPALEGLARVTATPHCSAAGIFPGFPWDATNTEQKKATTLFLRAVVWGASSSAVLAAMPRPCPCCQCRQGYLKGCFREETQSPVALVQELHLMRVRNVSLLSYS